METAKTYDKVSWHFPEGKGCPSLDAAKKHFSVIMSWLKDNQLLSDEGVEVWECGIGSDFAITGYMLTAGGVAILDRGYGAWLRTVQYGKEPSTAMLDGILREVSGRG